MNADVEEVNGYCRVIEDGKTSWCLIKPGHEGPHNFFSEEWMCKCGHAAAAHNGEAGRTWCTNPARGTVPACTCQQYVQV